MYYLGVDLGGTNIASAVVTEKGELLGRSSIPTGLPDSPEHIAERIAESCRQAVSATGCSLEDIESIGIGTPGITNIEEGVVEYSCNLDFNDTPLSALVEDLMHRPVLLENDANAAALGEYIAGSGKDADSLVAITLGTGVGGGVVINNRLLTGFNFAGGEIGHFVIVEDGEPCNCGRKGCFEAYCSASALAADTIRAMFLHPESVLWKLTEGDFTRVNGKTAFDGMRAGDAVSTEIVNEFISNLGVGLSSLVMLLQPEVIAIGGGISREGETLLAPLREIVETRSYYESATPRTRLTAAKFLGEAGIVGAAALWGDEYPAGN